MSQFWNSTACKFVLSNTHIYVGEYMCNFSSSLVPTDRHAHLSFPWTSTYTLPQQNRTSCSSSMCGKGGWFSARRALSLLYLFLSVAWGSHNTKCYPFSEGLPSNGSDDAQRCAGQYGMMWRQRTSSTDFSVFYTGTPWHLAMPLTQHKGPTWI